MRDERSSRVPVAAEHVEHAGREELGGKLAEHDRRNGRRFSGFQHDRVTGRERGRDLPDRHHQRVVPGDHLCAHADRLAAYERRVTRHVFAGTLAFEHARRAREEAQLVDERGDLVGRHERLRLAGALALRVDEPRRNRSRSRRRCARVRVPARRASAHANRRTRRPPRQPRPGRRPRSIARRCRRSRRYTGRRAAWLRRRVPRRACRSRSFGPSPPGVPLGLVDLDANHATIRMWKAAWRSRSS